MEGEGNGGIHGHFFSSRQPYKRSRGYGHMKYFGASAVNTLYRYRWSAILPFVAFVMVLAACTSDSALPTATATPQPALVRTPTVALSPTPVPAVTPLPTLAPTPIPTPNPLRTPTPVIEATPTEKASSTPTPTSLPMPEPTGTPTPSPTPTITPTPAPTATPTHAPTPTAAERDREALVALYEATAGGNWTDTTPTG